MKNITKGEFEIFISTLLFALMPIFIKLIPVKIDGVFISLVRFLFGILFIFIILKISKIQFQIYNKKDWILRGFFGSLTMIFYFIAIQITSSGRATLLHYTFPIFTAIFGYIFFKEKITIWNIVSLLLCIIGIIFIFYDGSKYSILGDCMGLLSGLIEGIAIHYIGRARKRNNSYIVYLSVCICGLIFTSYSINQVFYLNLVSLVLVILISIAAFLGQILLTYGFKYVSATKGSIITYAIVPSTLLLSYFIGEEFKTKFFIGIFFIGFGLITNTIKFKKNVK